MFRTPTTADLTASRRCSTWWRPPRAACSSTCASVAAPPETAVLRARQPSVARRRAVRSLLRIGYPGALVRRRGRPHDVGLARIRLRRRLEMCDRGRLVRHRRLKRLAVIFPRERLLARRSEEHTSELQSLRHLVCRLLLEKKNK